jgi:cob(I)alamin adenosyltransferase
VSVVATGRNAPPGLVEVADTVSEIADVKHAYRAGIRAKRGIDF